MARAKKVDKRDQFIQLVIKKGVDVGEVLLNKTYNEYFDFMDSYVGDIMGADEVLTEDEFNLIVEFANKYKEE